MSNLNRHPVRRTAAGVLASALAFSGAFAAGTPAFAAAGFTLDRLAGADRYATSAAIAAQFGTADGAILASGETGHIVDALSASFLAGIRQDPVLLTSRGTVSAQVLAQLNALTNKRVTIVGGEMAVSEAVATQLRNAGFTVTRLAGVNRYATSEEIIEAGVAEGDESKIGILVSGQSPVDALAAGALAYKGKHPVFLTAGGTIPQDTLDAMQAAGTTSVIIVGGTTVVPETVRAQLTARGISVATRLGGVDRSETSRLVADYLIANAGFSASTFNVASGANNGVDALSGAALSGKTNTVLLVTNTATNPGSVDDFATARAATLTTTGRIFGGEAVVSPAVETALEAAGGGGVAGSATARPELRTATIVSTTTPAQANVNNPEGTVVRYTFDEQVLSADVTDFRIYRSNGTFVENGVLVSVSGSDATVRFPGINATTGTTDANVNDFTLATVEFGAATDAQGLQSPEGDAAIGTASQTTTTATANTTTAPDLRSVSGFRQANPAVAANSTAIDFVFDQAAYVTATGDEAGDFNIVLLDGTVLSCTGPAALSTGAGGGTIAGGNGTTTITVVCANPGGRTTTITAAEVARGYVVEGVVAASAANAAADPVVNDNPLQSAPVSNNGRTVEADLSSATFIARNTGSNTTGNDQVLYVFDQGVGDEVDAGVVNDAFNVFFANGSQMSGGTVTAISADRTQVLVSFTGAALTDAVGASVNTATTFEPASAGVAPIRTGSANRVPGQVATPQLTGVALGSTTDVFGNVSYSATYSFDEDVDDVTAATTAFKLVSATGNVLTSNNCAVGTGAAGAGDDESFDNTVVCTGFTGFVGTTPAQQNAEIGAATLGTVVAGAVTEEEGDGTSPEGAEFTTGGTGTRA